MATKTQNITKGTKYFLYNQSDTGFTVDGYNLYGWDTDKNASIPEYAQEAEGSLSTNMDLYAIWSEKEIYHITFHPNGGYEEPYRQPFEKDVKKQLMKNKFTQNDYLFNGWSTSTNGMGLYSDEEEISIMKDMNLYALWRSEEEEPETPIIQVNKPLTFTSTGKSTISLNKIGNPNDIYLTYQIDDKEPQNYKINQEISLIDGQKLKMYATNENATISEGIGHYYKFIMTGQIAASGNINTLLKADGSDNNLSKRSYCYYQMFSRCKSLTQAPELPATTLAEYCYDSMFEGCTSLTQAPKLSAQILADYCYCAMFSYCTALTSAPDLPAETLANGCYLEMFVNCTNLTKAPELPAKTLTYACYQFMFWDCTSLTQAPELPATELVDECYDSMFLQCSQLSTLRVKFTNWNDGRNATTDWLSGVSDNGTFYCPSELSDIRGESNIPTNWEKISDSEPENPISKKPSNYLTFEAEENGVEISMKASGSAPSVSLCYSKDTNNWYEFIVGSTKITLNQGEKAYIAANNENQCFGYWEDINYDIQAGWNTFIIPKRCKVSGNINSLLNSENLPLEYKKEYTFLNLFAETAITTTPTIPLTKLSPHCYSFLFNLCKHLTQAPELPATELADGCYQCMFAVCTSLTQAPELPATTLAENCYYHMFAGCTSLTQAPELPATTLADKCYEAMFSRCSQLNTLRVKFTNWNDGHNATYLWVNGVSDNGTFYCPSELSDIRGESNIPEGWEKKSI